ncbi:MAG: signal peptide peptidase SppA [Thermoanaerobaculum sp.]|nr:signal peptide peptidase SppA [Thermoanaerobaculum sp.]
MAKKRRVLAALGCLALVVLFGVLVVAFAVKAAVQRLPGNAVLHVDIVGSIPERGADDPLEELLGPREVSRRDLRDALVKARQDPRIKAIRLKIHDCFAGMATVQEIREQLQALARSGKSTYAFLETAGEGYSGNMPYFLATGCQRVVLGPLGDLTLIGLRAEVPFIRGTLEKLGIEPEFPGVGDYKTARNFYIEKGFTPAHREMTSWLLGSLSQQLVRGIAQARGLSEEEVRALLASGPFSGPEALQQKLVDAIQDWSSFAEETARKDGHELKVVSLRRYLRSGRPDREGAPIAVVLGEGAIMRGESGFSPVPLFGGDVMGAETLARTFRQVRQSDARAVIFRINSPGGSAVASEIIRLEMERTAKEKPVVVSMGEVAGSGGYWITCGAQRIVADPGTMTGSIGVFAGHLAMARFWEEKLGVTWGELATSPNANLFGSLHPWTEEQRQEVYAWLDRIYGQFVERVARSRKLTHEQVDAIGRGRVFTGEQALERGLVDRLGGFDVALEEARKLAGLAPDEPVELRFYPRRVAFWRRLVQRDEEDQVRALLTALQQRRLFLPGPVWVPPVVVR